MADKICTWFAIKRLEIHDGPGVRTTLFLKGCPLHCLWCHNPESLNGIPQLAHYAHKCVNCGICATLCPQGAHSMKNGVHVFDRSKCVACGKCEKICSAKANKRFGQKATAKELLPQLLLDKPFFDRTGGGITVSGGEPLLQADFLAELLPLLKEQGMGTAIDTSLAVSAQQLEKVIPHADLFLCDIKAMDPRLHIKLTGLENVQILQNFRLLDEAKVPIEIRVPVIPGLNDGEIDEICRFVSGLSNVKAIKALGYHDFARGKYEALGMEYTISHIRKPDSGTLNCIQKQLDKAILR